MHQTKHNMKKIISLTIAACLLFAASAQAQRTVKNVKFGDYSMNSSPESFINKLQKNGWTIVSTINATDSQDRSYVKTTLEGKINGIEVSATVIPSEDLEKVAQIIMFTDSDEALNKTRYNVIKSWLIDLYDKPSVEDLELEDGNLSCYWGDFRKGERDLQKNHLSLTTVDNQITVATFNNQETALDATMNNIGDAIEGFGDKVHKTAVDKKTKVSKKAKKITQSAANGAKKAWQSVKGVVKKKD